VTALSGSEARELLRSNFGFADFLPGQAEVIEAVFAGRDAIAIMPTGSGKSLLYQLSAAAPGPGLVLVCSPLIALMRDQYDTPSPTIANPRQPSDIPLE
jgi:ATP-dependent DNA helicase RecQ